MSDMTSLERDTVSRNKIVSEINKNFFVEAGAGSGKTTMLVSRMVAMVESGIPIGKICAITFTKAAAGEFYDRFQKLLIERSNPDYVWKDNGRAGQLPKPTDETRERCAEALKNIDLCFMGTIDSFCSMVLSEHPSEAGIPSDVSLMSDEDAEIFYKQMYVRICAGEYGSDLASMAGTFRGLHRNPEEVFVKGESLLMNTRNVHFNYSKSEAVDIDKDFASQKAELVKALKCMSEHPEIISETNEGTRKVKDQISDIFKTLSRRWSTAFSSIIYYMGILEGARVLQIGLEKYGDSLGGLFDECGGRDKSYGINIGGEDGLSAKLSKIQYSVTMDFLESCIPSLETAMRDKGNMTFFDYLFYLRNMLEKDAGNEGNEGKLIRYIYDRHSYFLIDEFQDTNPMQAEVFFYLSSENPVSQWSACVPRPGSLFIVGDPKQSIYRFRSADVTSFLKVKGLFEKNGGEILSLSRNFRSTSVLCNHFNRCFTAMLPEETADQSKFEEIPVPDPKDDEFQGIFTYPAYTASLEAAHPDETDPKQIAKIIDRLVDNDEFLIRGGDDKQLRKIRYSDVMVITYGKKKLAPIMKQLDELGIPTRVEGQVPFGANEALFEVYKIYASVADINDSISLYGALTGRLIGITTDEMLKFREYGGKVSLKGEFDTSECTDKTTLFVTSKIEELKGLRLKALKLSPAALFAKILDDFRVYKIAKAENLEVVYYSLELMRNAERSGLVVSLKEGAGYMAQLLNGDSGEERCLSLNDGRDAVHMANLHKVKGLEAPVIILAAATQFNNSNDIRIVHEDKGSEGYLFALSKKDEEGNNKGSYLKTNEFPDEKKAESESGKAEKDRLVYVEATRARKALIICDTIQANGKGESHKSVWKPVMAGEDFFSANGKGELRDRTGTDTAKSDALYKEAEDSCILNDRSMETATYSVENPSRLHLSSKMAEEQVAIAEDAEELDAEDKEEFAISREEKIRTHMFPALLGTMTHKLMEMLVATKNNVDAKSAVSEIIREYRTPTTEPYEKDLSKMLLDVADKMRSGGYEQTNGIPKDILSTLFAADEVYCEVPFCYVENGEDGRVVWNGIMDVVYFSQGKWHIVDYKTNADGFDLDKKYKGQLNAYINAFKATTGQDADALTYHIDV